MSQAKVDRYKKEKENRKKLMRKQKMMGIVRKGVNYDSITDYLNGLSSAE